MYGTKFDITDEEYNFLNTIYVEKNPSPPPTKLVLEYITSLLFWSMTSKPFTPDPILREWVLTRLHKWDVDHPDTNSTLAEMNSAILAFKRAHLWSSLCDQAQVYLPFFQK